MKSIFEYLDYRNYLKDFYEERKSKQSFFSYRLFGARVGIDASYLVKVLIKTRHISESSIPRFVAFCGLAGKEAEYFETLVRFIKTKSQKESKFYFEQLLSIKSVSAYRLEECQYEYYRTWHHSAIRSVLEYYDFRGDFSALCQKLSPPVSAKEAKASIKLLCKLGLAARDAEGRYRFTSAAITTGDEWRSLAIQAFQEETIRLSAESLARHPKKHRDISTITMNINFREFEYIKERIREFRAGVIQQANECKNPDRTYQLNIQLFPLSKPEGGRP